MMHKSMTKIIALTSRFHSLHFMIIRHFEEENFSKLHQSFIEAFSSYKVPFSPSFDAFRSRMKFKLSLIPELSALVLQDEKCVGFLLQTKGEYEGKTTVYNGGTGVVPAVRGQNLTLQLFDFLSPALSASNASRLLLEVITSNDPAIKVYDRLGFQYRQTFRCYKRKSIVAALTSNREITFRKVHQPNFSVYDEFADFRPSFIDDKGHLKHNIENEMILEALFEDTVAGYTIFQPLLGRISQLGTHPHYRGKGIGRALINQVQFFSPGKDISLINVPDTYQPMHDFLISLGFQNEVDQYEMELLF